MATKAIRGMGTASCPPFLVLRFAMVAVHGNRTRRYVCLHSSTATAPFSLALMVSAPLQRGRPREAEQ